MKLKQRVTFTVDAYPDDVFNGTVNQIRMKPTTTSNVVTYTVIIDAPNPDQKLFPGMTASVTIVTEEETGLAAPAEAFTFQPSEQIMRELMKNAERPSDNMPAPQFDANSGAKPTIVWIKKGSNIMPRPVKTGMSDGAYKIIESGVQAGDSIVLSAQYVEKETKIMGDNPFMPGPPGKNKNNNKNSGGPGPGGPM